MNHRATVGYIAAALLAILLSSAPALAAAIGPSQAAVRPASTVTSVHGEQARPVSLPGHGTEGNVASMHLPHGAWLVVADASAANTDSSRAHHVKCDLVSGGDFDRNNPTLNRRGRHGSVALVSLMVVHRINASNGGHATLLCSSDGAAAKVTIGQVSMTALRAGILSTEPYGGPRTTTGSPTRGPRMLSVYNDGPAAIPGGFMSTEIAAVTIPAGNWVLVAKLYLEPSNPGTTGISCGLNGGGDTVDPLLYKGTIDGMTASLITATHLPSSSSIALNCSGSSATKAHYAKITAVKVGALSRKDLGNNTTESFGSGAPTTITAYRSSNWRIDGGGVATTHLPRGSWAVFGKTSLEALSLGPLHHVSCVLAGPGSQNTGRLAMKDGDRSVLAVNAVPRYSRTSGGAAALRCGTAESPSEVDASAVWIVAVKLHAVTRVTL